tara:strand:+ start:5095 stop:6210 length:1116 start_codon:yes stop_codon:yes gene_type:complete
MQPTRRKGIQIGDLFGSLFVLFVVFLFSSTSLFPQVVNNSLIESNAIKSGRYAVTFPALDTIEGEDSEAIITIGSSILQYATDGRCITEQLDIPNHNVYNLAISGANPYTEMIQIPKVIESHPRAVLLDLGPNSLWNFYESDSLDEYIQFRFTILSITMPFNTSLEWEHLLRERDKEYIATTSIERMNLTSSYSQLAFDRVLLQHSHDLLDLNYVDRKIPGVGDEGWVEYLQTPQFLAPNFELKNQSEVDTWFEENMPKRVKYGVYNPQSNRTLNHYSLEYTIEQLRNAGIDVFMIAAPHHPQVYDYLEPGQIDGHNHTLQYFEEHYGAIPINWFWETWESGMFRDRNHLGDVGREYYCERIAAELNSYYS